MHILLVHGGYQQTDGCHHHDRVRSFDRDDDVVEVFPLKNTQELHATLDDAFRCVAIARHDAVAQGTVVHADTDGCVVFLADLDKGKQFLLDLLQLVGIFLVGIFQMFESTSRVDIVAGIDAHLLTILGGDIGRMSREVDVGHQWLGVTVSLELGGDVLHVLCLTCALCGEAYQFPSGIDDAFGLCHTGGGIVGVGGGHRLDADGVIASYADITHTGLACFSSTIYHFNCKL